MRGKVKTTPLQREILWSLAATGETSLLALLRSLDTRFPDEPPPTLLNEAERSLGLLRRAGFLYLEWQFENERKSMLWKEAAALSLKDLIVRDESASTWSVQEGVDFVDLIVRLTMGGVKALELIASESEVPTPTWQPR